MQDQIKKYIEGELHITPDNLEKATEGYESEVYRADWENQEVYIRFGSKEHYSIQPVIYSLMKERGIPTPELLLFKEDVFPGKDLMVLAKASGEELSGYSVNDENMNLIYSDTARVLKNIHDIPLAGFGSLSIREGELRGSLDKWSDHIIGHYQSVVKLKFLKSTKLITPEEVQVIQECFDRSRSIDWSKPVFLHNDYHASHLFTDGARITSVIDFDKSMAGDPRYDVARSLIFQDQTERSIFKSAYGDMSSGPVIMDYMVLIAAGKVAWEYNDKIDSLIPNSLKRLKAIISARKSGSEY